MMTTSAPSTISAAMDNLMSCRAPAAAVRRSVSTRRLVGGEHEQHDEHPELHQRDVAVAGPQQS